MACVSLEECSTLAFRNWGWWRVLKLNTALCWNIVKLLITKRVLFCFPFSAKQLVRGEPNVSYICSRYYRAPELIFGATDYTSSIGKYVYFVEIYTSCTCFYSVGKCKGLQEAEFCCKWSDTTYLQRTHIGGFCDVYTFWDFSVNYTRKGWWFCLVFLVYGV